MAWDASEALRDARILSKYGRMILLDDRGQVNVAADDRKVTAAIAAIRTSLALRRRAIEALDDAQMTFRLEGARAAAEGLKPPPPSTIVAEAVKEDPEDQRPRTFLERRILSRRAELQVDNVAREPIAPPVRPAPGDRS